jgi:hypothetical protein
LKSGGNGFEVRDGEKFYLQVYMSRRDPLYMQYSAFLGSKLVTYAVTAQLHYFSVENEKGVTTEVVPSVRTDFSGF